MKKIISLLLGCFFSSIVFAAEFQPSKIIFKDGDTISGYAIYPLKSNARFIKFKTKLNTIAKKYSSDKLTKIIYKIDNGFVTYERRMRVDFPFKDQAYGPDWMKIIIDGYVTLYYENCRIGYATYNIWLCRREDEEKAKTLSAVTTGIVITLNPNSMFKKKAMDYFPDYPDIKNQLKEKKYNWKNIDKLVQDYNEWIDNK